MSAAAAAQRTRSGPMALALAFVFIFFSVSEPAFLSARNLSLLSIELASTALLALGMLVVLLPGQIDLAAGSGVGLFGAVAAVLVFGKGASAPLALLGTLVVAVLVWGALGALIITQRVPAFIITLGGLLVFKGLHWRVIDNQTVPVVRGGLDNAYSLLTTYYLPSLWGVGLALATVLAFTWQLVHSRRERAEYGFPLEDKGSAFLRVLVLAQALALALLIADRYRGLPLTSVLLAVLAFSIHVITQHTPFGRYLYAIGSSEEAALLAGVPIRATVIGAFALMGGIVALTGFVQTAYAGASTTTVGSLMELDAVAACVIGGTSLRGGRGSVVGVLFGALIMASLLNGMTLMALAPETKLIARGLVLALAVWLDLRLSRRS